ncbi:MAG: hypothetical protein HY735_37865 [Verrucomicrobia bacterium]|nr:hypothetical protein [Verrucomicrobiota bacterium]
MLHPPSARYCTGGDIAARSPYHAKHEPRRGNKVARASASQVISSMATRNGRGDPSDWLTCFGAGRKKSKHCTLIFYPLAGGSPDTNTPLASFHFENPLYDPAKGK